MCESSNGLIKVVLCLCNTGALEVIYLDTLWLSAGGSVDKFEGAGAGDETVCGTVLVTESVTADYDGLLPAWDEPRNARDDNGFTEDSSSPAVC